MLDRRDILKFGFGATFAVGYRTRALAQSSVADNDIQSHAMTHQFPPFELRADRPALLALQEDITGYAVERIATGASLIWVRHRSGQLWAICVDQRALQFKFEVFTLAIETMEAMHDRIAAWKPPQLPADMPENFRKLMSMQPKLPEPPAEFQPWPLTSWQMEVLRRAEYIVEDANPGPTFGDSPNVQLPGEPGHIPAEASASCETAVALLFTGTSGARLLIGVDGMPFDIVITKDAREIDEYVGPCERVPVKDYVSRLPASA